MHRINAWALVTRLHKTVWILYVVLQMADSKAVHSDFVK